MLDPFCGCGTTIDAAEKLGRKWIGIDITQLATSLIKHRLRNTYGNKIEIVTVGEPVTPNEAYVLAEQDKFQFQWWALGLVGARPVEQKKGADRGIDGKILFRDDPRAVRPEQIIIQVKGGKTGVKDVRDLRGVLDRERAAIGILISLQPPTGPMETEAASAGFYEHKIEPPEIPASATAHGEGTDGRQRHRTPVHRGGHGRDVQESAEGPREAQRPNDAGIVKNADGADRPASDPPHCQFTGAASARGQGAKKQLQCSERLDGPTLLEPRWD